MVLSLIYGKIFGQYKGLQVGSITFDNTISEEYRFNSKITSYPVERGTIISDHIINLPDSIVISGYVTDTPLNFLATFNRSISVFNSLIYLHETRAVVTVQTGLRQYQNMAIVSLDVPRTVQTGQSLTFNIELQRITFSDVLFLTLNPNNIQAGFETIRSNQIVASNAQYPALQYDPPDSLKDQASSTTNVGIQTLQQIPVGAVANLLINRSLILGRT